MTKSQRLQCRAYSKQSGERCKRFASVGKTLCNMHGGKTERVSAIQNVTHGLRRQYIPVEEAEAIAAKADTLTGADGVKAMLRASAARIDIQSERITDPENLPALLAARHSVRSDLSLLHTIQSDEDAADATVPTIVIADYSAGMTPILVRTGEATSALMLTIQGSPFVLDESNGAWWPAAEQIDEPTGATIYVRVNAQTEH